MYNHMAKETLYRSISKHVKLLQYGGSNADVRKAVLAIIESLEARLDDAYEQGWRDAAKEFTGGVK